MTDQEKVQLAHRYLQYSKALYQEGFLKDAAEIVFEVRLAMAAGFIPSKGKNNFRYAIRGKSSWEDYLQEAVVGAGTGAAAGAISAGAPSGFTLSGPGAAVGAGLGVATGLGLKRLSDWWYQSKGGLAQARAQTSDFMAIAQKATKILEKMNRPDLIQNLSEVAERMQSRINSLTKIKHEELSKEYGLDPNKKFWQNIVRPGTWGKALGRWGRETFYASSHPNKMFRSAEGEGQWGDALVDTVTPQILNQTSEGAANIAAQQIAHPSALLQGLKGGAAGLVGGLVTEKAYGGIENFIRGQKGWLNYYSQEMNDIGQEIAKTLNDPQFAQDGQNAALILQMAIQQLSEGPNITPQQLQYLPYGIERTSQF